MVSPFACGCFVARVLFVARPALKVGAQPRDTRGSSDGGAVQKVALPPRGVRHVYRKRGAGPPSQKLRLGGGAAELAGRCSHHRRQVKPPLPPFAIVMMRTVSSCFALLSRVWHEKMIALIRLPSIKQSI